MARQLEVPVTMLLPAKGSQPPHVELLNLKESDPAAVARFHDRWGDYPTEMLDTLRRAWTTSIRSGDRQAVAAIEASLANETQTPAVYNWRVTKGTAKRGFSSAVELVPGFSFWVTVCLLFLRDYYAQVNGYCANPDCRNPYFVQERSTQVYCGAPECVALGYRKRSFEWWRKHEYKGAKR